MKGACISSYQTLYEEIIAAAANKNQPAGRQGERLARSAGRQAASPGTTKKPTCRPGANRPSTWRLTPLTTRECGLLDFSTAGQPGLQDPARTPAERVCLRVCGIASLRPPGWEKETSTVAPTGSSWGSRPGADQRMGVRGNGAQGPLFLPPLLECVQGRHLPR